MHERLKNPITTSHFPYYNTAIRHKKIPKPFKLWDFSPSSGGFVGGEGAYTVKFPTLETKVQ